MKCWMKYSYQSQGKFPGEATANRCELTVAAAIKKVASELILSTSLSAFIILLTRAIGNIVVPGCFSAKDWRDFIIRLALTFGAATLDQLYSLRVLYDHEEY